LQNDFVFLAFISTRFSTELLKTFTRNLYFPRRSATEWFQKCLPTFPQSFLAVTASFLSQKEIALRVARTGDSCARSRALAIISCGAAKCSGPK
jgi:hypothetical protein